MYTLEFPGKAHRSPKESILSSCELELHPWNWWLWPFFAGIGNLLAKAPRTSKLHIQFIHNYLLFCITAQGPTQYLWTLNFTRPNVQVCSYVSEPHCGFCLLLLVLDLSDWLPETILLLHLLPSAEWSLDICLLLRPKHDVLSPDIILEWIKLFLLGIQIIHFVHILYSFINAHTYCLVNFRITLVTTFHPSLLQKLHLSFLIALKSLPYLNTYASNSAKTIVFCS